jgi:uncharacterized protein YgiM (DUF1202 family)
VYGYARVTANVANLREGPGVENAVIATLSNGAVLEILAYSGDWIWVNVANTGYTGFIHHTLVAEQ